MMVWVASYPRSGNKFARTILSSLFQARTFTVYDRPPGATSGPETPLWEALPSIPQRETPPEDATEWSFVKTHELSSGQGIHPAIYVVRDGRDSYVSYAHYALARFPTEYGGMAFAEVLKLLVGSTKHFGGWSAHVNAWTTRLPPTALLRYEDMRADPAGAVAAACRSIGIDLPEPAGVLPTFEELHVLRPHSVRKGLVGGWREEMPPKIEDYFWSVHGLTMERMGYAR
jgi:hypothetical protein